MGDELKLVIERFLSIYPDSIGVPATDEAINEAEAALNVRFPVSYRWFVSCFGGLGFPADVYGVYNADVDGGPYWDVVYQTESERSEVEPPLDLFLVALCPDGMGNHWCLNTHSMDSNGECPVVFWNHDAGPNQKPALVASTFSAWLQSHLLSTLDD